MLGFSLLDFIIFLFFAFACFKGYTRGGFYEMVTLIFSLLGLALSIYASSFKSIFFASSIFVFFYILGYIVGKTKRKITFTQKIFGLFFSFPKVCLFFCLVFAISMKFEPQIPNWAQKGLVSIFIPGARKISEFL